MPAIPVGDARQPSLFVVGQCQALAEAVHEFNQLAVCIISFAAGVFCHGITPAAAWERNEGIGIIGICLPNAVSQCKLFYPAIGPVHACAGDGRRVGEFDRTVVIAAPVLSH
ncbi:MAG: hypothetical protein ACRYGK_03060 [Janthinobacterium lividum]